MFNAHLTDFLPVRLVHRCHPEQHEWLTESYELLLWNGNAHSSSFAISGAHFSSSLPSIMLVHPQQRIVYSGSLNAVRVLTFNSIFLDAFFAEHRTTSAVIMPLLSSIAKYADTIWDTPLSGQDIAEEMRMSRHLYTLLTELFINWDENAHVNDSSPSDLKYHSGRMIVYATRYIKKNISNADLSLEEIAHVIGYHPNYFCQEFKRIMNISPFKFVARVRIDIALHLLRTTDESMQSICKKTGIKKPASLSAIIKKQVGMPPLQYRRTYKLRQLFPE